MAQTNTVQNQPSMDDILASIRRIIDDGNKKTEAVNVAKESVANDDAASDPSQENEQIAMVTAADILGAEVLDQVEKSTADEFSDIGVPELDSFLETLDAKYETADSNVVSLETAKETVSIMEPAKVEAPKAEPAHKKYEQRFTSDDRTAFEKVGSALAARTSDPEVAGAHVRPAAPSHIPQAKRNLVSEQVQTSIGNSFESLSEALAKEAGRDLPEMTEDLLKPMLSEWLDNNLPAMVERLVRAEIERIARGD